MIGMKRCECGQMVGSTELSDHSMVCAAAPKLIVRIISDNAFPFAPMTTAAMQSRIGINCNQQEISLGLCKYCDTRLNLANKGMSDDICSSSDCFDYKTKACSTSLKCGHQCHGTNGDECLPCLYPSCKDYGGSFQQNKDSQCCICLYALSKYPAVMLPCDHIIHEKCIESRILSKWNGKTLSFQYISCPLCNKLIANPSNENIADLIKPHLELYEKVEKQALEYFEHERLGDTEEFKQSNSDRLEFALSKFVFYMCNQCENPFYAGFKNCIEQEQDFDNDPNIKRLCLDCFDYTKIKGVTYCDTHGRKHIQYKCRFCCNVASHFCFGTTHFCEDCHFKQLTGDYLTSRTEHEKCDPSQCFLKGDHPPNGEEYGLYCIFCNK
jgi:hypothetical protein